MEPVGSLCGFPLFPCLRKRSRGAFDDLANFCLIYLSGKFDGPRVAFGFPLSQQLGGRVRRTSADLIRGRFYSDVRSPGLGLSARCLTRHESAVRFTLHIACKLWTLKIVSVFWDFIACARRASDAHCLAVSADFT